MWRRLSNGILWFSLVSVVGGDWIPLFFLPSLGNYQVGSTIFEMDLKLFFWKRHSDSLIYWEAVCIYIYIMIYSNIFEKPQNRQKKMERGPAVLLRSLTNFETLGATDFDPSQYFILFEMLVVFEFSRVIQFLLVLLAARFLLDSYITLLCIRPIWL